MAKVPAFAKAFAGRWRIVEMDVWETDVLDLGEEAHLSFQGASDGEIAFVAVKGFLDPSVQFGLQFETVSEEAAALQAEGLAPKEPPVPLKRVEAEASAGDSTESAPKIVSLDAFRKK